MRYARINFPRFTRCVKFDAFSGGPGKQYPFGRFEVAVFPETMAVEEAIFVGLESDH